ncbi:MAG: DUF3231 family protein [Clostridiales bacterium]|nr:DUF3231 family protein [Clostridiales bacterium]MCF8022014.1 DUF3231 family protein [Clostridiales bacterium]
MPYISIFKNRKTAVEEVDSIEVFNIWNLLRARYNSIETHQLHKNFIHDRDLLMLFNLHLNEFKKQVAVLEDLAKEYKVKTPRRPPREIKVTEQIEDITDKMIFRIIFNDLLAELFTLERAYRNSTTNDSLRKNIVNFFFAHSSIFTRFYKYGKVKAWVDVEPSYKTAAAVEREPLATSEANHIWDHLNTRYDQIQLTMVYQQIIHDKEFNLILSEGLSVLEKQIKMLEDLALKYDIPLPARPPAVQKISNDPEMLEDEFIYRMIFSGIQTTLELHFRAVIDTVRNDKLKSVFTDLLKTEINIFDKLLKFGKMKGWLNVVPM